MMGSIGSVTKSDTPCKLFPDPTIGQMEELEGHICNILGPKAVAQVKANTSAVQATRVNGVNKIKLNNIWIVSKELASKSIDKNTQLCKHHAEHSLSRKFSTNDRMLH